MQIKIKDYTILIDDGDYEYFKKYKWHISNIGYVRRSFVGGVAYLHREVMKPRKGQEIDHINRNKLDNRRSNLRFSNRFQNTQNRDAKRIYKKLNRFQVKFQRFGQKIYLGSYKTYEEARQALENYNA